MTFDEKLAQALKESFEERVEQSLNSTSKHRFSLSYRLWERKMLHDIRRNRLDSRWTLHKARRVVTAIAIVTAVVLSLTGCAIVSLAIGRFSFDDKSDYSKLFIQNLSSDKIRIEEYYGLPEEDGWVIGDFYADDYGTTISYSRGDKSVTFSQRTIHKAAITVNTENAVVEPMSLYEENDGFFIAMNGGNCCYLCWIYDGYLFSAMGNLNKEELVNLVYSTKIINF